MKARLTFLTFASCFILLGCGEYVSTALPGPVSNYSPVAKPQPPSTIKKDSQSASGEQGQRQIGPIFDPILLELQQKTDVPLRLPTYLATEAETNPLYAIVEKATPEHYEVQVAFTRDCSGGNACHYGTLSGQAVKRVVSRKKGKPVSLVKGITGYFVDAKCGANCSDSVLVWMEHDFRYTIGIKAADMETLIRVANSAIAQ